jgi:hypothetical protein
MKRFLGIIGMVVALLGVNVSMLAQTGTTSIESGYYYIYANGSETQAIENMNLFLRWDPLERGNAAFIFHLQKADDGEDQYWMQSLADSSWFYGCTNYYITEMRAKESDKRTIRFVPQDDGTFKIRPTESRPDLTGENEQYNFFLPQDTRTDVTPYDYHPLAQWSGSSWTIEKVPDYELTTAELNINLNKALDCLTSAFKYTTSSEELITNGNAKDESTGDGSQFLSVCQRTDDASSSFANLIDRNTSTYFQSTWDNSMVSPQWIQVDAGKELDAFQLKIGVRDGVWGSAEQWTNVSLFATNDMTTANNLNVASIDQVEANPNWTRIGDYTFSTDKSLVYGSGNWNKQQLQIVSDLTDRYLTKNFILPDGKYRYLRFYVNQTAIPQSDNKDFTLGELQMYENTNVTVNSNVATEVENLKGLIAKTKNLILSNTGTSTDVKALEDAIAAIKNKSSQAQIDYQALIDSISSLNLVLLPGENPGYNDSTKVKTYKAAFAAAEAATHEEHTDAEFVNLGNQLRGALVDVKNSVIPVTDGYYNLVSGYPAFFTHQGVKKAMCGMYDHTMAWTTYNTKDPLQLFKVTKLSEGNYSIQNIGTGEFIGSADGTSQTVPSTSEQTVDQIFSHLDNSAEFNIYNKNNNASYNTNNYTDGDGVSGNIVPWAAGAGTTSSWFIIKVKDAKLIDSLTEAAPAGLRNYQATQELAIAQPIYEQMFRYNIDHTKGLITNADDNDPDNNQLWGTQEPSAVYSSYTHLIDGDLNSCFQSTWQSSVASPPQWLQVDLKDHPVQNFQFYFGLRDGIWGALEQWSDITVYATNEEALAKDENIKTIDQVQTYDGWKKIGEYQLPTDLAKNNSNGSGRGFYYSINRMDQAYRFLRFFVNSTYSPQANMMFTIGEFQIYENILDEANSPYVYIDGLKNAGDNLALQIKNVKESLTTNSITQEELDKLIEARKAVSALVPNAAPLEELLTSTKTYVNKFEAGEKYGDVTSDQWTAIQNAITEAEGYDHSWPKKEDLDQRYQNLTNALSTFKSQQIQFEPNKWYYIVNQDNTRTGSAEIDHVPGGGDIYSTFCYGNVAYAASDNTQAAQGNWGINNYNAVKWGYYVHDTKEAVYQTMIDPHTMWRFVPIEGQTGVYAIQNRANGKYMSNYTGDTHTWIALTDEPKAYNTILLGSGQYELLPPGASYALQAAGDGYLYSWSSNDEAYNNQWAWTFEAVPSGDDLEFVQLQIPDNSIQIISLPYVLNSEELADYNTESGIQTYAIKSFDVSESGDSTLSLIKKKTFEAGEPFVLVANNYAAYDVSNVTTTVFAVVPPESFSFENKTVNGLTSTLDYVVAPKIGLGYFVNSVIKGSTSETGFAGHTGYVDLKAVVDADPNTKADLVIKLNGTGVTSVKGIIANNEKLVNVYSIDGKLLKQNVKNADAQRNLSKGVYVIGKKKVLIK